MARDWFDALFGRVLSRGRELELRGGIDFRPPLNARADGDVIAIELDQFSASAPSGGDDTAAIVRVFERANAAGGGVVVFPAGTYQIKRPAAAPGGADSGGVAIALTASIRVECAPGTVFTTDDLDNDMFRFTVPSDGAGLPDEGIVFEWYGGTFDQREQRGSTSMPFLAEYPPTRQGASATCDALSLRFAYTDGDVQNGCARAVVQGVRFIAGDHWESAGGDSGLYIGEGTDSSEVSGCEFIGSRDLGIYASRDATGVAGGSLNVFGNTFRNCMFGVAVKRSFERFSIHDNAFENCVIATQTNTITGTCSYGAITANSFSQCSYFVRLDKSQNVHVFGNYPISLGALLEDGATTISPYAGATAVGYLLRGATYCRVEGERCLALDPAYAGTTARLVHLEAYDNDGPAVSAEYNLIADCLSIDFGRVVEEQSGEADNNRIERCYNYGSAGLRDPQNTGANTAVIRLHTSNRWSFESGALFGDGSSGAPSIARRANPNVGLYFTSNEIATTRPLATAAGTAAAPTHTFAAQTNLGFYRVANNELGVAVNGTRRASWGTEGLALALVASATPANNGDLKVELTSDTQLTFRVKGSDGTVRSVTLTLAP